jgi:hypothetical protein
VRMLPLQCLPCLLRRRCLQRASPNVKETTPRHPMPLLPFNLGHVQRNAQRHSNTVYASITNLHHQTATVQPHRLPPVQPSCTSVPPSLV